MAQDENKKSVAQAEQGPVIETTPEQIDQNFSALQDSINLIDGK